MVEYDIVTREIVELQIKNLESLISSEEKAIDYYLVGLSAFMNAGKTEDHHGYAMMKRLLNTTSERKKKHLEELEVKRSVLQFLKGGEK